jgi:hypothetical protein
MKMTQLSTNEMSGALTDDLKVLYRAFDAWMSGNSLRSSRARNKRFTFGDQWGDLSVNADGKALTDWERFSHSGTTPVTNNMIRQLVKTVVGRFRAQIIDKEKKATPKNATVAQLSDDNELDELDARALEEFLISGCCIQRIDRINEHDGNTRTVVSNVNPTRLIVNAFSDPLGRDCRLVGQLHDLTIAELLQRVAGGSRRKAAWVRKLYSEQVDSRTEACRTQFGADGQGTDDFWHTRESDRLRAIEVWTLESREVMVCHNRRTAQLEVLPVAQARKLRGRSDVAMRWDVFSYWHCRWFSPMGDLLAEWDAQHGRHPFVMRFYPLIDGEVHSMVEDVIDQQKYLNRLISLVDQAMMNSAKGVLLYPDTALPDGLTWSDVRRVWSSPGGILPYSPTLSDARPEQIQANATDFGAYDMINLQMKLLEEISGVHGALQGKNVATGGSASLYQMQSENADIALTDIYDSFNAFRRQRDALLIMNDEL